MNDCPSSFRQVVNTEGVRNAVQWIECIAVTCSVSFDFLICCCSCFMYVTRRQVVFGGELQEKGCKFELRIDKAEDLNRCVCFYHDVLRSTGIHVASGHSTESKKSKCETLGQTASAFQV